MQCKSGGHVVVRENADVRVVGGRCRAALCPRRDRDRWRGDAALGAASGVLYRGRGLAAAIRTGARRPEALHGGP